MRGFLLLILAVPAFTASAQYTPGDVIVTEFNSPGLTWPLWGITPQGRVYTVTSSLPFLAFAIAPAPDNRSLWVSGQGNLGCATSTITPNGIITHINVDKKNIFGNIDVDGGGNALLGSMLFPDVLMWTNGNLTTVFQGSSSGYGGGGLDLPSGDLVLLNPQGRTIDRISLHGKPASTLVVSGPRVASRFGLHDDPDSGTMVGAWRIYPSGTSAVYRLTLGPPAALVTLRDITSLGEPGALDRDPFDGQYVIPCTPVNTAQPATVMKFDARTASITRFATFPATPPVKLFAATVAGSRHLCGANDARVGQIYTLMVSSPGETGVPYAIGCSFGFRPGIPVGAGRKIHLSVDALFNYSLLNTGIFKGFQGVLSAQGEAAATITIPPVSGLSGFRFFAVAVTVKQGRISVISDPLGVTIL